MKIEAKYTIEIQGKEFELTEQELWELKQKVLRHLPEPSYAPQPYIAPWISPPPYPMEIPCDKKIDVWYSDETTASPPAYLRNPTTIN